MPILFEGVAWPGITPITPAECGHQFERGSPSSPRRAWFVPGRNGQGARVRYLLPVSRPAAYGAARLRSRMAQQVPRPPPYWGEHDSAGRGGLTAMETATQTLRVPRRT